MMTKWLMLSVVGMTLFASADNGPRLSIFGVHVGEMARQRKVSVDEAVSAVRSWGFEAADLWFSEGEMPVNAKLLAGGLKPASLVLFMDYAYTNDVASAEAAIAYAKSVGSPRIMLVPGYVRKGDDRSEARKRMLPNLRDFMRRATAAGIQVDFEDFDASNALVGSQSDLRETFAAVPELGHVLDTGNYIFWHDDVLQAQREFSSRIRHVHIKDRPQGDLKQSTAAGTGVIPVREILANLRAANYSGWITVEDFGSTNMWDDVRISAEYLRKTWKEVDAIGGQQLLNLLEPPPKEGRFVVPADRVWPAKAGEADVCLWAGDRYAACAITIDDNCPCDHDWWLKLFGELDIKATWFLITDGIAPHGSTGGGSKGNWDAFQRIADAGHSIQSHTTNHKADPMPKQRKPDTKLLTDEELNHMYKDSMEVINANVTNNLCCCIGYPCGDAHAEIAAKYAIAARGVAGFPSPANAINYMNTNKGGTNKNSVDAVADPKCGVFKGAFRRGLNVVLYHYILVGRDEATKAKNAAQAEAEVRYVASLKDDRLWVCRFDDAMKYGQERDTAKLAVTETTAEKIVFTLTDDMKDDIFDFPLTVKVRLPDNWKSANATQRGKTAAVKIVEHDGATFALVEAIPDRGAVELVRK